MLGGFKIKVYFESTKHFQELQKESIIMKKGGKMLGGFKIKVYFESTKHFQELQKESIIMKKGGKMLGGFKIKVYFCAINLSNEQLFITKEFN